MAGRFGLFGVLVVMGAGWGITQPLAKIAVSDGYRHVGIIFWQLSITIVVLGTILVLRGRRFAIGKPQLRFFAIIALIGTVIPNTSGYQAAVYLPAGVLSITMSLVPIFAFPVAILFAVDRFGWGRLAGLILGLAGVLLLVVPKASLPDPAMAAYIPLALLPALCYGLEGNVIAKFGTAGLDPIQLLFGASLLGAAMVLPFALATGTWIDPRPPWGLPDGAILASSLVHAMVYSTYFWLVGRAGAVFAVQVSYLVTGFGVLWSMLLLGERYSGWIWLAGALILAGMALVQPRPKGALVPDAALRQDTR